MKPAGAGVGGGDAVIMNINRRAMVAATGEGVDGTLTRAGERGGWMGTPGPRVVLQGMKMTR